MMHKYDTKVVNEATRRRGLRDCVLEACFLRSNFLKCGIVVGEGFSEHKLCRPVNIG